MCNKRNIKPEIFKLINKYEVKTNDFKKKTPRFLPKIVISPSGTKKISISRIII